MMMDSNSLFLEISFSNLHSSAFRFSATSLLTAQTIFCPKFWQSYKVNIYEEYFQLKVSPTLNSLDVLWGIFVMAPNVPSRSQSYETLS